MLLTLAILAVMSEDIFVAIIMLYENLENVVASKIRLVEYNLDSLIGLGYHLQINQHKFVPEYEYLPYYLHSGSLLQNKAITV